METTFCENNDDDDDADDDDGACSNLHAVFTACVDCAQHHKQSNGLQPTIANMNTDIKVFGLNSKDGGF